MKAVLEEIGLRSGDRIIELGAGTGRYTELLLSLGLDVIAAEPDPTFRQSLAEKLDSKCEVTAAVAGDALPEDVVGMVGFHVLHHLDGATLQDLNHALTAAIRSPQFKGAVFLEPNPLNPLYLPQILLTPGMKLREEWRLWIPRFYRSVNQHLGVPCHVGLIPPSASRTIGIAPARACRIPGRWCPWSSYRVIATRRRSP